MPDKVVLVEVQRVKPEKIQLSGEDCSTPPHERVAVDGGKVVERIPSCLVENTGEVRTAFDVGVDRSGLGFAGGEAVRKA